MRPLPSGWKAAWGWGCLTCSALSPDEDYEILSSLPESVVYNCRPCSGSDRAKWRDVLTSELRKGLRNVLQGMLASQHAEPLLQCAQVRPCAPEPGETPPPGSQPLLQCPQVRPCAPEPEETLAPGSRPLPAL